MIPAITADGKALLLAGVFLLCLALPLVLPATPALGADDASDSKSAKSAKDDDSSPNFLGWWDWWLSEYDKDPPVYERRLVSPLRLGRNNFLHHLVLLPPMEGFRTLKPKDFSIDTSFEGVRNSHPVPGSAANRFDASYFTANADIAYGLTREIEVRAGFNMAYFVPDNDDSIRLTQEGEAVYEPDDFDPKPNIGNLTLGVKLFSAFEPTSHLGLATTVTLKIPVGKQNFLSSGRGDVAILFHGTWRIGLTGGYHLFAHICGGVAFFDEENVFPSKVYLNSCSVYGASLVFPLPKDRNFTGLDLAFLVQAQGNSHVFRKMDAMNSDPHTLHFGLRVGVGSWTFDGSVGFRISPDSASDLVVNVGLGADFGGIIP